MNATSGRISPTPFAYYDRELSCWRTSQATLALDLTPSSVTLPRSGSMRNGELFARPTLARLTGANGCSSLLVTPTANLGVNGGSQHPAKRKAGGHGPTLADQVEHLLPTPAACNPNDGEQPETWLARRERVKVTAKNGNGMGTPLAIAVQLLPTPTVGDSRDSRNSTATRHKIPPTGIHAGNTLTDILVPTGANTRQPSNDGNTPPDDQHRHQPNPDATADND